MACHDQGHQEHGKAVAVLRGNLAARVADDDHLSMSEAAAALGISRWRTPRHAHRSATLASTASKPGCPAPASPASSTRWLTAGSISDDGGAGMAPREAIWLA
jgi:hypothetical protein